MSANGVGPGHISPLAAYDSDSDRFLLMDVARYRFPPVWIKAQDLYAAMNTQDTTADDYRGYLVIGKSSVVE